MSSLLLSATEIRPIEAESVRRIVAGQAVTDLASAVKELVDNALDAGSKSINSKCVVLCCVVLQVSYMTGD
jgi:DNA mismatch repair protein PMS2